MIQALHLPVPVNALMLLAERVNRETLFVTSMTASEHSVSLDLGTAHHQGLLFPGRTSSCSALLMGKQVFLIEVKIRNVLEDQWSGTTPCSRPSHTP